VSANDGIASVNEAVLDEVYGRIFDAKESSKPTDIVIVKEDPAERGPWKNRRVPENFDQLIEMIRKLGLTVQGTHLPIEKAISLIVNRYDKEFDEVYLYDKSKVTQSLIVDDSVSLINEEGSFTKIYDMNLKDRTTSKERSRVLAMKGIPMRGLVGLTKAKESELLALYKQYGSIKSIYENIKEVESSNAKLASLLMTHADRVSENIKNLKPSSLSEIKNIEVEEFDDLLLSEYRYSKVKDARIEKSILRAEGSDGSSNVVVNLDDLAAIFKDAKKTKELVMTPVFRKNEIVGIAIGTGNASDGYIELKDDEDNKVLFSNIAEFVNEEKITLFSMNAKLLAKEFIKVNCPPIKAFVDVGVVSYLFGKYIEKDGLYDEAKLCESLGVDRFETFDDFADKYFSQVDIKNVRPEFISKYASSYVKNVISLGREARSLLGSDLTLKKVYAQIDMPITNIIARMEIVGVKVDERDLSEFSAKKEYRVLELAIDIENVIGRKVQIFKKGELPLIQKELNKIIEDHEPSDDKFKDAIKALEHVSEISKTSLVLNKAKNNLKPKIDRLTGRVHASFNQKTTATSRFSSTNPNLQGTDKILKHVFKASTEDRKLIVSDYSQMEMAVIAHITKDKLLIKKIKDGCDLHKETAAVMFKIPPENVTKEQRSLAKVVNFGIPYGMSEYGLARQLNEPIEVAKAYLDAYFDEFKGVKAYVDKQRKDVRENLYVTNLYGRKFMGGKLDNANSPVRKLREEAAKAAINYPIQGGASDIMKSAMIKIDKMLKAHDAEMIIQIHDEVVVDVAASEADIVARKIKKIMESTINMMVDLQADVAIADSWDEGKDSQKIDELEIKKEQALVERPTNAGSLYDLI